MTKVIFIDWNKTLSHDLFWGHMQNPKHPYHKHHAAIEKWLFIDNLHKINGWMRGDTDVSSMVKQISSDTGISSSLIEDELRHSCEIMTFCFEELESLVAKIRKKGIKVVIATDNMDTFSRYTVPAMKLDTIFDDILNSYHIGYLKDDEHPDDKIPFFDGYLEANGFGYEDSILLDDSIDKSNKYERLGFSREVIESPQDLRTILVKFARAN